MMKSVFGFIVLVTLSITNVALAGECAKTLMGNNCESNAKGVSTHMRGNAAENAKAAQALKAAQAKAKKTAKSIAAKN